jgi:hypothetical protein
MEREKEKLQDINRRGVRLYAKVYSGHFHVSVKKQNRKIEKQKKSFI